MIEAMLEAERALAVGLLDQAERLYAGVVAADPRNSIAVVGLARVALERGDERASYVHARRALALDPDNPMASHLVHRIEEILAGRGEAPPEAEPAAPGQGARAPSAAGTPGQRTVPAAKLDRPGVIGRFLRRRR